MECHSHVLARRTLLADALHQASAPSAAQWHPACPAIGGIHGTALALLVGEARGRPQLFPQKRSKFTSEHCLVL